MNKLVELFRQYHPDDQRSDDEITLDIASQRPEVVKIPGVKEDLDRISNDALPDSSAVGSFARGVGRNIIPAGGTAAGALIAGGAAAETGPGAIAAAVAGGVAGGVAGSKVNKVLGIGQDEEQIKADQTKHPIATKMGEFLGQIPAMFGAGGPTKELGESLVARGLSAEAVNEGGNLGGRVAEMLLDRGLSPAAAGRIGKLANNAIGGAIMSGGSTAAAAADGKASIMDVPADIIKGAVTMGPVGFIPHAASVLGAIGWKAPTDAAVLGLSNALYDHFVRGKDIDPKALSEQIGTDIPGFMLMNGLTAIFGKTPFAPTKDGKITSEPAQAAKEEIQGNSIDPAASYTKPSQEEEAAAAAREQQLKEQFPNAGVQTSTAEQSKEAPPEAAAPAPAYSEMETGGGMPAPEIDKETGELTPTEKAIGQDLPEAIAQVRSRLVAEKIANNLEDQQAQRVTDARRMAAQTITGSNEETASEMPVQPQQAGAAPTPAPQAPSKIEKRLADFDAALEKGRAQLVQGEQSEAGQKNAALYTETADPDIIFSDTTARGENGKVDNKLSPKTVAMLSPDGNTVVEGTAYRSGRGDGRNKVTMIDADGNPVGRRFNDLLAEGWKPLATMKGDPTRDYAVTYSRDEWNRIAIHFTERVREAKSTAGAMEEHLEAAKEFGRERGDEHPTGDELVESHENAGGSVDEKPIEVRRFTREHAEAIFDALDGLENLTGDERDDAFTQGIAGDRRALAAVKVAIKAIREATELDADEAFRVLQNKIYDYYDSGNREGKEGFIKSVNTGKGSRPDEVARPASPDAARSGNSPAGTGGSERVEAGADTGAEGGKRSAIEAAAAEVNTAPSDAQKQAGNYKKGHVEFDGLDVTLENPKGSTRSGKDANGQPWEVEMPAHYGYVKGTEGIDGDHVDVYIGDHPESDKVFVIDQINLDTKKFDEHKAMLGFNSREEAVAAYVRAFSDNKGAARIGEITEMPKDEFVDWVHEGDTKRPLSYGKKFSPSVSRFAMRSSDRGIPEQVASHDEVASRFNDILEAATTNGLNVKVIQDLYERGQYSPREVTLAVADPMRPSQDNITLLFHEIGHDVFRYLNLPHEQEAAFHRAIEKLAKPEGMNIRIAPGADSKAVTAEEVLVERAARNLSAEGFNPAESMSVARRMMNHIKRLYYRAAMAIQRGLLGEDHVNPELAQRYFEERVKAFLTGNTNPMSFLSFIGGPKLRTEQLGATFEIAGGAGIPAGFFDYENGVWEFRKAGGSSLADMDYNAKVRFSLDRHGNNETNEKQTGKKYTPERLPPEAERTLGEGNLRAAAGIARGVHQAIADAGAAEPSRGRETVALNRQIRPKEEAALKAWAKDNGLMLDDKEFTKQWKKQGSIDGAEHQVYIDNKGIVWKRNDAIMHGTWLDYLHRIALHNAIFPDTALTFHGLMEHSEEPDEPPRLYAVVSQKAIDRVRGATREEVKAEMAKMGFISHRPDDYYNPKTGVIVQDLHDENAVINKKGSLVIFDPIPAMAKASDFVEGGQLMGQQKPAIRYSERGIAKRTVNDPHIISADLDSPGQVQEDVAAFNELGDAHRMAYKVFMGTGKRPAGYTFESFLHDFLNVDATTEDKINRRNAELEANGHSKVDPSIRTEDLVADSSRTRAANTAYRWLSSLKTWMNEKRNAKNEFLKDAQDTLDKMNSRLTGLLSDYTDMSKQFANAKAELSKIHDKFIGDTDGKLDKAKRLGVLSQVIKQLDARMGEDPDISKQYRDVVEKLYRKISGDTTGNFVDMLHKVSSMDLDWKTIDVKDAVNAISKIIAPSDPELKGLENRAMAAMTVAFAKRNAHVMELLKIARSSALDERAEINKILKDAIGESRDALPRAKELAKKLPTLGKSVGRLLDRIEDLKADRNKQLDDIKRAGEFVELHQEFMPVLNDRMKVLERTIGARLLDWEAYPGAEYFVAPSEKSTDAQVEASKATYDNRVSRETLIGHINGNHAWLDSVPENNRGALWDTVNEQTKKLEAQLALQDHELVIKRSFVNSIFGNIVDKLESTGLPELASAARRIRQSVTERYFHNNTADNAGIKFNAAESRAMKALGLEKSGIDRFQRIYLRGALSFAEKNSDLRTRYKTDAEAFEALLPRLREYFESNPDTEKQVRQPGAWKALENYFRVTYENMQFVQSLRRKMGGKIEETLPNGQKIYREPIGSTFFTSLRKLSGDGVRMYQEMRDLGWAGTDALGTMARKKIAELYEANRDELSKALKQRFTSNVWLDFVRPLVEMDGRSNFYAPEGKDGISPLATRSDVLKAFNAAGGDVIKFAENLYDLTGAGSSESKAEFVGKTMEGLQQFFDSLHATQRVEDYARRQGIPTPGRLLQDARVSESWPKDWLDYASYGRIDMHRYVDQLTQQAAYGRNMEAVRAEFEAGKEKLTQKVRTFNRIVMDVEDANPTKSKRALKDAIKAECAKRGENYTALSQAADNLKMVEGEQKSFEATILSQSDIAMELKPALQLISSTAGMAVQGPGTAALTMTAWGQAFGKLGLSGMAAGTFARSIKGFAGEAFNTMAQAFHLQMRLNADSASRRLRNGIIDPDSQRHFKDVLESVMHETKDQDGKGVLRLAKLMRSWTSTGIGSGDAVTLKPHAFFSMAVNQIRFGLIDAWTRNFEDMIARATDYFKDPKNAGDLNDAKFRFNDAQQLGYSKGLFGIGDDTRGFEYLRQTLARNGMDLETLARDAVKRGDGKLLTDAQFRAVASMVINEVTLEASNLQTRPSRMISNPVLRMASPLVGWSIAKAHDNWEAWRRPDMTETSQNAFKAFRAGVTPYLAVVPFTLALAYLRSQYEEKGLKKKANRESATDSFGGLLDASARMGTFGIFGEWANAFVNEDVEKPFSVDGRVFAISSAINFVRAAEKFYQEGGNPDYQTVVRPAIQALGGAGYLQYAQLINHALGADNAEARVTARINALNWLRVEGKEAGLDVRVNGSGDNSISNPIKPFVGQMVLAAYANDPEGFRAAYQKAVQTAREHGDLLNGAQPDEFVKRQFKYYNPLGVVFKTEPTPAQVQTLLSRMNDDGRAAVESALRLYNGYAAQLGLKPDMGKEPRKGGYDLQSIRRAAFGGGGSGPVTTLLDARKLAAGF